jgi:hypothetical protein
VGGIYPVNGTIQNWRKPMDNFTATMIAEGVEEATEEEQIEAWQHLINTGLCWQLQGFFGRQARALIEAGICTPAGG